MNNIPGSYPKRVPIGIYDSEMVTRKGEDKFRSWDDYACRLLLQRFDEFIPMNKDGTTVGWQFQNVDYSSLKLFGLSLLWRANASNQPAFSKVDLGSHEPIIRELFLKMNPEILELDPEVFELVDNYLQQGYHTLNIYSPREVASYEKD